MWSFSAGIVATANHDAGVWFPRVATPLVRSAPRCTYSLHRCSCWCRHDTLAQVGMEDGGRGAEAEGDAKAGGGDLRAGAAGTLGAEAAIRPLHTGDAERRHLGGLAALLLGEFAARTKHDRRLPGKPA